MTIISRITKQTRLSKKTQNAGDVESSMTPQVAGRKMLCVIRVIKRVTYPHVVRMSKISALKETKRKVKVQENEKGKGKGKGKGDRRANQADKGETHQVCEQCGKYHQRGQPCKTRNLIKSKIETKVAEAMNMSMDKFRKKLDKSSNQAAKTKKDDSAETKKERMCAT